MSRFVARRTGDAMLEVSAKFPQSAAPMQEKQSHFEARFGSPEFIMYEPSTVLSRGKHTVEHSMDSMYGLTMTPKAPQYGVLGPARRIPMSEAKSTNMRALSGPRTKSISKRLPIVTPPPTAQPSRRAAPVNMLEASVISIKSPEFLDTSGGSAAALNARHRNMRSMSTGPLRMMPLSPVANVVPGANAYTSVERVKEPRPTPSSAPTLVARLGPKYAGLIESPDAEVTNTSVSFTAGPSNEKPEVERLAFEFEYDTIGPMDAYGVDSRATMEAAAPLPTMSSIPEDWSVYNRSAPHTASRSVAAVHLWEDESEEERADSEDGVSAITGSTRSERVFFDHDIAVAHLMAGFTGGEEEMVAAVNDIALMSEPHYCSPTVASLSRGADRVHQAYVPLDTVVRKLDMSAMSPVMASPISKSTAYRVTQVFGKSSVRRMAVSPGPLVDHSFAHQHSMLERSSPAALNTTVQHETLRFGVPSSERIWRTRPVGSSDPVSLYQRTQRVRESFRRRMQQKNRPASVQRVSELYSPMKLEEDVSY